LPKLNYLQLFSLRQLLLYTIIINPLNYSTKEYFMGKTIEVKTEDHTIYLNVDTYPDTCPFCHKGIDPRFFNGFLSLDNTFIEATFQCPRSECQHLFIGYYDGFTIQGTSPIFILKDVKPEKYEPREFNFLITSVSNDFVKIYNQSEQAEKLNLSEIAGPGYRKSVEFLIKDYVISKKSEISETVKTMLLGDVISNYIDDSNIKTTAKRAAWLGNDETHYYRRWENKDIDDLKILIELTVRWIESVQLTEEFVKSMPEGKK
jgi:hypothetical protein